MDCVAYEMYDDGAAALPFDAVCRVDCSLLDLGRYGARSAILDRLAPVRGDHWRDHAGGADVDRGGGSAVAVKFGERSAQTGVQSRRQCA